MHEAGSDDSSGWYRDETALESVLRRAMSGGEAPGITGYDALVEIAHGGQGVVYRGTQSSTRRNVAVKLLAAHTYSNPAALRRFQREVDLVARLRHPGIVQIYDSGTASDGRPYFVMEYIDGATLDEWLRRAREEGGVENRATLERIIRLFSAIAEALQYAHQRGVLHRDLKPRNIRVSPADEPRVLDFGVARATDVEDPSARTRVTSEGQFVGSLAWASPEQVLGENDIDLRSDLYSFGVMLYQALGGTFPYDVDGGLHSTVENIAHARPAPLVQVDSELNVIVQTCLAKSPEERYQSAADLAGDLRRYLAGEPIAAQRETAWRHLRRELRRYRLAAWVVGTAASLMLVSTIALYTLYGRATRAEQLAESRGREAMKQAANAQTAKTFLQGMFQSLDPYVVKGRDTTVLRSILDDAVKRADEHLGSQPEVEADVRGTIGYTYWSLGDYNAAERQLRRGHELLVASLGDGNEKTVNMLSNLAGVLQEAGRYGESRPLQEKLLQHCRSSFGAEHRNTLVTMNNLAFALDGLGDYAEAEKLYREAVEAERRVLGPLHEETQTTINNLGSLLLAQGRLEDAEPLFQEVYKTRSASVGEDHPTTLFSLNNLAHLEKEKGEYASSEQMYRTSIAGMERRLGAAHPRTLTGRMNLAELFRAMGKHEQSIGELEETLTTIRKSRPDDAAIEARCMSCLGEALYASGRLNEALSILVDASGRLRRLQGEDHPHTLAARSALGHVLLASHQEAQAVDHLRAAYAGLTRSLGARHPKTVAAGKELARLTRTTSQPNASEL